MDCKVLMFGIPDEWSDEEIEKAIREALGCLVPSGGELEINVDTER